VSISPDWNLLAGLVLLAGGAALLCGSFVLEFLGRAAAWFDLEFTRLDDDPKTTAFGSDTPAPDRVSDYLDMINGTVAPNCLPETRWEYAFTELTRAEVMAAELERLQKGTP